MGDRAQAGRDAVQRERLKRLGARKGEAIVRSPCISEDGEATEMMARLSRDRSASNSTDS